MTSEERMNLTAGIHREPKRISGAVLVLAVACLWPGVGRAAEDAAEETAWLSLFDGESLDGWIPKIRYSPLGENYRNTFRAEDGVLTVSYDEYETFENRFGHLFYEHPFSSYILQVEYRFTGEKVHDGPFWAVKNSGVMIHCQAPETMALDQDFPVSIEVQFLGGLGELDRTTGNVCTPGTHVVIGGELIKRHETRSSSPTFHGEEWVMAEIEVHGGDRIIHRINGETVIEYTEPQLDPRDANAKSLIPESGDLRVTGGYIALQSESHPIEFRNIRLLPLDE